jgi:archaellum component FlaC
MYEDELKTIGKSIKGIKINAEHIKEFVKEMERAYEKLQKEME